MAQLPASPGHIPLRSCLFMPGSNRRAIEKSRSLDADCLIFDLEDAVAPDAKPDARAVVSDALDEGGFAHRQTVVRINALNSQWGQQDLLSLSAARADVLLVPKVDGPEDVLAMERGLADAGSDISAFWVMIETPRAVLNAGAIAAMSQQTRLAGLVLGTNDLGKDMEAEPDEQRSCFVHALSCVVTAARGYGIAAIDGVFNDFTDAEGLATECSQGRRFGFEGKSLIHPQQIAIANAAFAPDSAKVEEARAIAAAFAEPGNADKGVIRIDGRMVELLHLVSAEKLIAKAEAIALRQH